MKTLFGNTEGLKKNEKRRLENLYRRKAFTEYIVPPDLCRELASLSFNIKKQIGILINRAGKVVYVIIGDSQQIVIPKINDYKASTGRLMGLKCIHTHLKPNEHLSQDDLTDLSLLRLDLMAAVTVSPAGEPHKIFSARILPGSKGEPYEILKPLFIGELETDCISLIKSTEHDLSEKESFHLTEGNEERAILVSVTTKSRADARDSLDELEELAITNHIEVVETILQIRKKKDARFLLGRGKLNELSILCMQKGVNLLIFDQELNPSQIKSISDQMDIKIIDRTQMILDIFARRAKSKEGKLQVELAQLKYILPRLITHNTAMSRLTGGIGGRGPGETKLELNRRRVRDRINMLQKSANIIKKQRKQQKSKRKKKGVPVVSIVGYTNAGKSTLLNTMTKSKVHAENQLFATLDPTNRRLRFPMDLEVIITDTVGFIRDLPKDLMASFMATLEELESADLLLHVIDISNPRYKEQIESVNNILEDLSLNRIKTINVLNKSDLIEPEDLSTIKNLTPGITISAKDRNTLSPLLKAIEENIVNYPIDSY